MDFFYNDIHTFSLFQAFFFLDTHLMTDDRGVSVRLDLFPPLSNLHHCGTVLQTIMPPCDKCLEKQLVNSW